MYIIKNYSHYCILGDFNYRDINWQTWTTPHNEGGKEAIFIETIRDCFLHQHIHESTRRRRKDEASLVDLISTDETIQVSDIVHHAPLGKSDHSVISFKFHSYLDYTKPKERYSCEKADFQAMRNHLAETKWEEEYLILGCGRNKDELWNHLKLAIYDLRDQFVPKKPSAENPRGIQIEVYL